MDRHEEFLDSTAKKFPQEFLRRLRRYHLTNHNLSPIPQGQFGFAFSWGYFNYVSLDTMKNYLKQVFQALRPGGVFMFSYNDGDTPSGAGMAEKFSQTYMPKSLLVPLCELHGFEVVRDFDFEPNVSWLEIKKPGTLQTVKAHQVLGKPMGIPVDYDPVEEHRRLFKDGEWIDTVEIRWVPKEPKPL
jgi:SAM-dependent methyltransferase